MKGLVHDFQHFQTYLKKKNYIFQKRKDFKVIKRDLTREDQKGNVFYENNGIFLEYKGAKYQGYVSLKEQNLTMYPKLPRFHVVECLTIVTQKSNNTFDNRYFWSNSKYIDIKDSSTGKIHRKQKLELCKNCINVLKKVNYTTTIEFSEELEKYKQKLQHDEVKLNSFGRPFDWNRISKSYRVYKNYKCERCNFDGSKMKSTDKRFIEVDHIIAWEYSNLNENNLQCLCVLCHSQKDERHKLNYSKGPNFKKVEEFIAKYRIELKRCNNPYIVD